MRGVKELKQAGRWLRSRLTSGGLILLYHRIFEDQEPDPFALGVSAHHFEEHLLALRQMANPVSLQGMVDGIRKGTLPRRAIAITFDDGYADNLYLAKPLLERYQLSATVFVITGSLGGEYWWDELARLLLQSKTLPEVVSLSVGNQTFHWKAVVGTGSSLEEAGRRSLEAREEDVSTRLRLLRSVYQVLQPLREDDRQDAMQQVRSWAGASPQTQPRHRALTADEVRLLGRGGRVTIGAHTVDHLPLAILSSEDQRAEIFQCKAKLTEILGQPPTGFAYPYGMPSTYTAHTVAVVHMAGFDYACAAFPATAWRGSDLFQLPRLWVQDWDGDTFNRKLARWLGEP